MSEGEAFRRVIFRARGHKSRRRLLDEPGGMSDDMEAKKGSQKRKRFHLPLTFLSTARVFGGMRPTPLLKT